MLFASKPARTWLAVCLFAGLTAGATLAADRLDAPNAAANPDFDIADVYIFRSPTNAANAVIALTLASNFNLTGGINATATDGLFQNDAFYRIFVDRNADNVADLTITATFNNEAGGQEFTIAGLTTTPIKGTVTPVGGNAPVVAQVEGVLAFAGPRDDPFFFDRDAFNDFFSSGGPYKPVNGLRRPFAQQQETTGVPVNGHRGNVAAIVIEVPVTRLTGGASATAGSIRLWTKTFRNR